MGTKISALPSASTLTGSEIVPMVQSGADVTATVTQILAGASGGASYTSRIQVGNGGTDSTTTSGIIYAIGRQFPSYWSTNPNTVGYNLGSGGTIQCFPIMFGTAVTTHYIGLKKLTNLTGGTGGIKYGIYDADSTNLPHNLLGSATASTGMASGGTEEVALTFSFSANKLYYLAFMVNSSGSTVNTLEPFITMGTVGLTTTEYTCVVGGQGSASYTTGMPSVFGVGNTTSAWSLNNYSNTSGSVNVNGVPALYVKV